MKGYKNASGRNARSVVLPSGDRFDSVSEYRRWLQLCALRDSGAISDLKRQVKIPLWGRDGSIRTPSGRQMFYVADFTYSENGNYVVEDSKGFPSDTYKMKKAILAAQGIFIRET